MCTPEDYSDYDVEIDARLYDDDYDNIPFEEENEDITESDILFE